MAASSPNERVGAARARPSAMREYICSHAAVAGSAGRENKRAQPAYCESCRRLQQRSRRCERLCEKWPSSMTPTSCPRCADRLLDVAGGVTRVSTTTKRCARRRYAATPRRSASLCGWARVSTRGTGCVQLLLSHVSSHPHAPRGAPRPRSHAVRLGRRGSQRSPAPRTTATPPRSPNLCDLAPRSTRGTRCVSAASARAGKQRVPLKPADQPLRFRCSSAGLR